MPKNKLSTVATRRKFLGGAAVAGAATVAMPQVSRAQTVTLKMQSSWGPKDIFQEMAQQYVDRAQAMAGGRLKIDLLASGAVVKAFQVQDACHKGVLDGAHTVCAYWYGKNKAASLFGTGPVFGCNAVQTLAWIQTEWRQRRRQGPVSRTGAGHPEAQSGRLLRDADADPAARLVQGANQRAPTR